MATMGHRGVCTAHTSCARWAGTKALVGRASVLATALALAVSMGACGGSSTKTSTSNASGVDSTPASTAKAPTVSTVKATGGGDFCKQVADSLNTAFRQTDTSPDAVRKTIEQSKEKSQAAFASAPAEIKADLRVVFDASLKFDDELAKVNYDFTKLAPGATASLTTPQVQTASAHVNAYVKQTCGIDVTGGAGGSTPSRP